MTAATRQLEMGCCEMQSIQHVVAIEESGIGNNSVNMPKPKGGDGKKTLFKEASRRHVFSTTPCVEHSKTLVILLLPVMLVFHSSVRTIWILLKLQ